MAFSAPVDRLTLFQEREGGMVRGNGAASHEVDADGKQDQESFKAHVPSLRPGSSQQGCVCSFD
jgi:hypothetical protein